MKKVSLDFFGEKVNVNMPTSLKALRDVIAEKFYFDPKDAAELLITYAKDLKTKAVKTEQDFVGFLKEKWSPVLKLDISENSRLYKVQEQNIDEEALLKAELEQLEKEKSDLEAQCEEEKEKANIQAQSINLNIIVLRDKLKALDINLRIKLGDLTGQIEEKDKRIKEIQEKLNNPNGDETEQKDETEKKDETEQKEEIPNKEAKKEEEVQKKVEIQPKPKTMKKLVNKKVINKELIEEEKKKEKNIYTIKDQFQLGFNNFKEHLINNPKILKEGVTEKINQLKRKELPTKQVVHENYICDGCEVSPIVGVRYKCAICEDFDYCENCEEKFSQEHQHPFIKIVDPKLSPTGIRCVITDSFPSYKR